MIMGDGMRVDFGGDACVLFGSKEEISTKGNKKLGAIRRWNSAVPYQYENSAVEYCVFNKINPTCQISGRVPVYLNVYDLTPANGYVYWVGLGAFHSGVQVHGVEYAFGSHDFSTSGVFEVKPRQCPGFKFRKSLFMGTTSLDRNQVRELIDIHSVHYNGNTYHLIMKNCNHFSKDLCHKLTGNIIPRWVNRLAGIGSLCNCLLPDVSEASKTQHKHDFQECSDEQRILACFL